MKTSSFQFVVRFAVLTALCPAVFADIQAPPRRTLDEAKPPPPASDPPPAAVATPAATPAAAPLAALELPPTLNTADLLGADSMSGPNFRVRATAPTDGYMAHITIDSDFGTFNCVGVDQARQRIHEIGAISRLVTESKGDVFADALKKSIEQPIDAVKNIVKDPGGTLAQAPKTIGHFFKRLGSSIKEGAEQIADTAAAASDGDDASSGAPRASTGDQFAAAGRGIIGFDKAKLDCAKQLGIDPYTDNPVLQENLEKVSWVYFAGGLPIRVGAAAASGGASLALTSTTMIGLPDEVYALTPSELALKNRESLEVLGVPETVKTAFMNQPMLTPTLKRSMLRSLEELSPAGNRASIIDLASQCQSLEQAQFLDRSLRLLAERQRSGFSRYTDVLAIGRVPVAVEAKGGFELAATIDHLSWTEEVAKFAARADLRDHSPILILTGGITDQAIIGVQEAGWKLARPQAPQTPQAP